MGNGRHQGVGGDGFEGSIPQGMAVRQFRLQTFSSLAYRDFRLLWMGQLGHSAAQWMDAVARNWLIWELSHSALLLGAINFTRAVPMLTAGLLAGAVADRVDKRKILMVNQVITGLLYFALAMLVTTHLVQVWHVFVTAFIKGVTQAFLQPARTAMIPELVEDRDVMNAISLNQVAMNVTRVVGPSIAGALVAFIGTDVAFYVAGSLYAFVVACTLLMHVPPRPKRLKTSIWRELNEGFRYVGQQRIILSLLVVGLAPMLFGMPYMSMLPVFSDTVLHTGSFGYGFLAAASGFGALAGGITIASLGEIRRKGLVMLVSALGFGLAIVGFAFASVLPLALVLLVVVGGLSAGFRTLTNTLLLANAPPEMHGRVMSMFMLDAGLMPLGSMMAGTIADVSGVSLALIALGFLCALAVGAVMVLQPQVRRME